MLSTAERKILQRSRFISQNIEICGSQPSRTLLNENKDNSKHDRTYGNLLDVKNTSDERVENK